VEREITIKEDGKILVLSDIHYPYCDINLLNSIVEKEKPSLIVLLGDIIVEGEIKELLGVFEKRSRVTYIKGDEDVQDGDTELLRVYHNGRKYIFLHGHQYFNERSEYSLAKLLMRINKKLPPFLFCLFFRILLLESGTLILGHSHALVFFKTLNCANAGTLTTLNNLYHDLGYITINDNVIDIRKL